MKKLIFALILFGLPVGFSYAGPADQCLTCHGPNRAMMGAPNLNGQEKAYLVKQLENFKNGSRQDPMMSGLAGQLDSKTIDALSDFFSKQSCQ